MHWNNSQLEIQLNNTKKKPQRWKEIQTWQNCTILRLNFLFSRSTSSALSYLIRKFSKPRHNKYNSFQRYYNYKKANLISLYQSIGATDWSFLNDFDVVDSDFDEFYCKLYSLIKKYVPSVKVSNRHYPPWFEADLIRNIKKKYRLI